MRAVLSVWSSYGAYDSEPDGMLAYQVGKCHEHYLGSIELEVGRWGIRRSRFRCMDLNTAHEEKTVKKYMLHYWRFWKEPLSYAIIITIFLIIMDTAHGIKRNDRKD